MTYEMSQMDYNFYTFHWFDKGHVILETYLLFCTKLIFRFDAR